MSHLFQNLVYSACDGMPHGGRIKVRFAHQTGEVVTEIEDSGPGVSREVAEHLFEPFAQYARGKAPGLELAICARIIEAGSWPAAIPGAAPPLFSIFPWPGPQPRGRPSVPWAVELLRCGTLPQRSATLPLLSPRRFGKNRSCQLILPINGF